MKTAAVVGGTGLIGAHLVRLLADDPSWDRVVSLTRRSSGVTGPGLEERQVDFEHLDREESIECDAAFCALGTTIKVAGSKQAFERVDHDYVVEFARLARAGGAQQFLIVSSIGADAGSGNFYLSVKGRVEVAVEALAFESTWIFRPSLLLGERQESRPAERWGQRGSHLVAPLMVGPLRKYRPIPAETVASGMASAARRPLAGVHTHDFAGITALAAAPR
jgi:uncharacterized protein YbjT (DUF2867 family)